MNWIIFLVIAFFIIKSQKWKNRCKWSALALFIFFSNTAIFLEFCRLWEIPGTKLKDVNKYEVGIVLGGMAEYNNDLETLSLRRGGDRIWQALHLYHKGKIRKILISGDSGYLTDRGLHEAEQLEKVLLDFGIPQEDLIVENTSVNTYTNAVESVKILNKSYSQLDPVLLITSGTHMKRALACFEKQGLYCVPFSTDLYSGSKRTYYWDQILVPNASTIVEWDKLIKEWVGYLTYKIVGYA